MLNIKNWQLVVFTLVGILLMTYFVLNREVKIEVREMVEEKYKLGKIDETAYLKAMEDNKLSNLEVITLGKK